MFVHTKCPTEQFVNLNSLKTEVSPTTHVMQSHDDFGLKTGVPKEWSKVPSM